MMIEAKINSSKYILLGNTGFIGTAIQKYLEQLDAPTHYINREHIDLEKPSSVADLQKLITPNTKIIMTVGVKKQFGDNVENWLRNEAILGHFIKALLISSPAHLVYVSSAAVYGEDTIFDSAITEDTPLMPRSFYSISKINAENILGKISREKGFPICFARPPLIYGSGDSTLGYGPTGFCYNAVHGKEIRIWGDGTELREFIWVDDLARILLKLSQIEFSGNVNTVSGVSYSFTNIVQELKNICPKPLHYSFVPRTGYKTNSIFSPDRLRHVIGEFNFTPLSAGLNLLYKEFEKIQQNER